MLTEKFTWILYSEYWHYLLSEFVKRYHFIIEGLCSSFNVIVCLIYSYFFIIKLGLFLFNKFLTLLGMMQQDKNTVVYLYYGRPLF